MSKSPGNPKRGILGSDDLDQLLKDEMGLPANGTADSSTDGDDSEDGDFQNSGCDSEGDTTGDESCDDDDENVEDDSETESLAESVESVQPGPPQLPMSCLRDKKIPNFRSAKKGSTGWTVGPNPDVKYARVHAAGEPPDWDNGVINSTSSTDTNKQAYGILQIAKGKLPENISDDAQLASFLDQVQKDPAKFLVFQPLSAAKMKEYMKYVCNIKGVKFSPRGFAALVTATEEGNETADVICKVKEAPAMAACFPFPYVSSAHIKTKPSAPKSTPPVAGEPKSSAAKPAGATKLQKPKPVSLNSRLELPVPTVSGTKQSPKKSRSPSRQLFCAPASNQKRFKSTPSTRDEPPRKELAAEPEKNSPLAAKSPKPDAKSAPTKKRSVDTMSDGAAGKGPPAKKALLAPKPKAASDGVQIEIKATFTNAEAAKRYLEKFVTM